MLIMNQRYLHDLKKKGSFELTQDNWKDSRHE